MGAQPTLKGGLLRAVFRNPTKDTLIAFRCTEQERKAILDAAARVNTSVSGYLRQLHAYAIGTGKEKR